MKKEFFNEKMETMGVEELRPVQEEKFLKQMAYVWDNSPFYQEKFKAHGINRNDIKMLDDLKKLPFTEKDDLRKSQEAILPWVPTVRRGWKTSFVSIHSPAPRESPLLWASRAMITRSGRRSPPALSLPNGSGRLMWSFTRSA